MTSTSSGRLAGDDLAAFMDRTLRLLTRLLTFPVPTAAALNGHAFGIGAMLALAHDRRVMRPDRGWFCLPEIDLGMQFHPLMLALVTHRLPGPVAEEAILSGRRYDGAAAVEAGIAHSLADLDDLVPAAVEADRHRSPARGTTSRWRSRRSSTPRSWSTCPTDERAGGPSPAARRDDAPATGGGIGEGGALSRRAGCRRACGPCARRT